MPEKPEEPESASRLSRKARCTVVRPWALPVANAYPNTDNVRRDTPYTARKLPVEKKRKESCVPNPVFDLPFSLFQRMRSNSVTDHDASRTPLLDADAALTGAKRPRVGVAAEFNY